MSEKSADASDIQQEATSGESGSVLSRLWIEVANKYEGYQYLDKKDRETLHRHGWGAIVSHWAMTLFMLLAIVTGVAFWTGWYGPMNVGIWDGYYIAFLIHIWAGVLLAVVAFVVFPYYHVVADGDSLLVSVDQIKEEIIIALSFVGLASYIPGYKKARRTYDEDEEEWAGYHPMQTVFWYVTWFFVAVLTLTGFALWEAIATDPVWWVSALGFMEGWIAYENMLRIHLVATFFVVAAVAIHAYFPMMPSNFDMTKSMIYGKLKGWSVDEETRPEPQGRARAKDELAKRFDPVSKRLGTSTDVQEQLDSEDDEETDSN
ncbi:formate dehydrogenase subunit gamma [Halalkaliarchaeum desulfuricum]|uniref:Formate dehydrogenase subunit gamma n=1 Tax=Halalkaliarchaeum desulfuricum TaxID=2055893 RepID=A0A343TGM3_9EURY|nr:cytochrome b/b6 domain-containing protein [Halalkaliarchaeum desulfuricum]AUX08245.1 formate dehydrogenase subunit gamma [Halalkaliarchaeum desulfuricum]